MIVVSAHLYRHIEPRTIPVGGMSIRKLDYLEAIAFCATQVAN